MFEFYFPQTHSNLFPFISYPVNAGEAAENDAPIEWMSLDDYVAGKQDSVLYVRVRGDSMIDLGIETGDLVVVDRLKQAENGAVVLARINSTYTIKKLKDLQYYITRKSLHLVSANVKYVPRKITQKDDFEIIGVITHLVKKFN